MFFTTGSTKTDFGPQLQSLNKDLFTVVGWDPRGYGRSRPPDRHFPPDFFESDAKDAVDLMKVKPSFHWIQWSLQQRHLCSFSRQFIIIVVCLAGAGLQQVHSAGVERWRHHRSDSSSQEPSADQQDGCVGIQCLCLSARPQAL